MQRNAERDNATAPEDAARSREQEVVIGPVGLAGILVLPQPGKGTVVFAHGSGSGRKSPRNNQVARQLQGAGLGTLLLDLLTEEEARDRANVFDIELLARRLILASDWLREREDARTMPVGFFGASTGAAAALVAETYSVPPISAIVSRGGRPDLAGPALLKVRAPTLLIVGSLDHGVIELNQEALAQLTCEKEIAIVNGAGHLFEEPGTLDMVVQLARRWFDLRLRTPVSR
ncbi:dienelactone hydrolase family protein [Virgifigura deserti]|uniref:dienelactone hydrolase family protein n=1 Tax=Virgifigura deserti TaxID=2268457 RepID=UPI003CCC3FD2